MLFRDEQQRILNRIIESEWGEAEAAFGNLYPHSDVDDADAGESGRIPDDSPGLLCRRRICLEHPAAARLGQRTVGLRGIRNLIGDAEAAKVALDVPTLEYTLRMRLERMAEKLPSRSRPMWSFSETLDPRWAWLAPCRWK